MKCKDCMSLLPMYPDELPQDRMDAFHRHIEECTLCRQQWEQHQEMLSALNKTDEDLSVPDELHERWMSTLYERNRKKKHPQNQFRTRLIGLAASALIILGTILMREGIIFTNNTIMPEPMMRSELMLFDVTGDAVPDSDIAFDDMESYAAKSSNNDAVGFAMEAFQEAEQEDQADWSMDLQEAMVFQSQQEINTMDAQEVEQWPEALEVDREPTPLFKRISDAFFDSVRTVPEFLADLLVFLGFIAPYVACFVMVMVLIAITRKIIYNIHKKGEQK